MKRWLPTIAATLTLAGLLAPTTPASAAPALPDGTQLVSISNTTPPVAGNYASDQPSISADGRYIAFRSFSTNLTDSVPIRFQHVYWRDTVTGTTRLVSATASGEVADGASGRPSISADGQFVAFVNQSVNLYPDATGFPEAVVWSAATGVSQAVSVNNDPTPAPANAPVIDIALSADGTAIAWTTAATNLTAAATNGRMQVYVRDLLNHKTTLVSRNATSALPVGGAEDSSLPVISGDGNVVAFVTGSQLTSTPTTASNVCVYAYDRAAESLAAISLNVHGTACVNRSAGSSPKELPAGISLSADGRYVAYTSAASDAVAEPANPANSTVVFVRDRHSGTTVLATLDYTHTRPPGDYTDSPSLSADGRLLAFRSHARDVVSEGTTFPNAVEQIYSVDLRTGESVLVSRESTQSLPGLGESSAPVISADGRRVAFTSLSRNLTPEGNPNLTTQVFVRSAADNPSAERIGGADRYEVSATLSAAAFASEASSVVIASGEVFADALSGSALAGLVNSPVLLVNRTGVPGAVAAELVRLKPKSIIVLGGEATIPATVEATLRGYAPVTRIGGADRFEVSAAASKSFPVPLPNKVVYVASGAVYPDALSGSAAAGLQGAPVLLVTKDGVPSSVADAIARLAPTKIIALGGANTISDDVIATLNKTAPTTRIGGSDRFEVSAAVSAATFTTAVTTLYVASGANYPDALSGSAAAIASKAPVLLVTANTVPDSVAAEIRRLKPRHIVVLGGPNSISESVVETLKGFLPSM